MSCVELLQPIGVNNISPQPLGVVISYWLLPIAYTYTIYSDWIENAEKIYYSMSWSWAQVRENNTLVDGTRVEE